MTVPKDTALLDEKMSALVVPASLLAALWAHARREAPRECVGVLGGRGAAALALYPLANVASRPERAYRADDRELLRAFLAMRSEALDLVAIYHSHPHGPPGPSAEDRRLAGYDVPYLIADLAGGTLRAFLLPGGEEVEVRVEDTRNFVS